MIDDGQKNGDLDDALTGLHNAAQGKQFFKALQGVDAAEFGLDGLP
ncbi:hypothetical protein SDC9_202033 [bioreactor metagenome]|uniref:Uncharacterized protein n=1 Tax=bioreactor metagenome TaxID=1076179 RepID=A0A645J4F9_9ZZZZ